MSAYHEHPVFVYGTLKRGCPNHHLIENVQEGRAEFLANGVSSDPWPLVVYTQFNVPFVLDRRGTGKRVHGEIYRVNKKMLDTFDELENYPNAYHRDLVEIVVRKDDVENFSRCRSIYEHAMDAEGKIKCEMYILKDFKKDMLEEEHLEKYTNSPKRSYCFPSEVGSDASSYFYLIKEPPEGGVGENR